MCGRFTGLTYDEVMDVIRHIEFTTPLNIWPDWPATKQNPDRRDMVPSSIADIIKARPMDDADQQDDLDKIPYILEPASMVWGYKVGWQKQPLFNTRIESALEGSKMWRDSIANGRCIIPTAGFYEVHREETVVNRLGKELKKRYFFKALDGMPTLLAGVCEDGQFSVVTTEPNDWVAPIHDRMPLVLRPSEVPIWIADAGAGYASLSDRGEVGLDVTPVIPTGDADQSGQLSLF